MRQKELCKNIFQITKSVNTWKKESEKPLTLLRLGCLSTPEMSGEWGREEFPAKYGSAKAHIKWDIRLQTSDERSFPMEVEKKKKNHTNVMHVDNRYIQYTSLLIKRTLKQFWI
jgi:hypothetical protein